MRILLVNRFFGGDEVPTGRMLYDLAFELAAQGCQVEVLTSQGSYLGGKTPAKKRYPGIRVRKLWTGSRTRFLEWSLFLAQVLVRIPAASWDRCVILTDPPFLSIVAVLARICGRKGLYWWTMDLYPEAIVAKRLISNSGVLHRMLRKLNESAISSFSGVICLGTRQLRRLETYESWPKRRDFYIVVPPWDRRELLPVNRANNRFLNNFGWQDRLVALYAGNLGEAHSYKEILEAARVAAARSESRWIFVFVVRGANRPLLEAQAKGLHNLVVLDYQPEELTSDMLWAANIHLITMRDGWEGVVVPSKLYGVLQTRAPLLFIGPSDADTATEIRALGAGETLSSGTRGEELVEALERLVRRGERESPSVPMEGPKSVAKFVTKADTENGR